MSKGLPPPESDFPLEACAVFDAAADVVLELVSDEPFTGDGATAAAVVEVVVLVGGSPIPPSADDNVVVAVVDARVVVLIDALEDLEELSWVCGIGTDVEEVFSPRPPVTPAPPVGMVTDTAGVEDTIEGDMTVTFADDDVEESTDTQRASTIPPAFTLPNNVLALTVTSAQALVTLRACDLSPDTHIDEQPFWKSDTVQEGISLS